MPVTQKQKPGRGIPRKAGSPARKAKHNRYLVRATCFRCSLVFRSPKYKNNHINHGHQILAGVNKKRCNVENWNLLTQGGKLALK